MQTIKPRAKHLHETLMRCKASTHKDPRKQSRQQLKQALRKEIA